MVQMGLPFGVALPLVVLLGFALGGISELLILTPFRRRRGITNIAALCAVAGIGVSIVADTVVSAFFGSEPRTIPPFVQGTFLSVDGVQIRLLDWLLFGVAVFVAVVFEIVMLKTSFGRVVRGQRENPELVSLLGVAVPWVDRVVFASAGALAAASGFLVSPIIFVYPTVGQQTVIPVFAALVIGGLHSFRGALIGGLLVGIVEEVLPNFLNASAVEPLLFLLIVVLLVIRPEGLISLGKRRVV
jgi:branched-chain amino acid transport system permease protein